MADIDDRLIDVCSAFIEKKQYSYLAKEGLIVHYMSITGRKKDFMWHKQTIAETLRIVRALELAADEAKELREHHLITAFQETSRVYEFGVKTRHAAAEGLFNYSEHAEMSLGDEAMSLLVETLQVHNFNGVFLNQIIDTFAILDHRLKLGLGSKDSRDLLFKHFESAGYEVKTGSKRPLIDGKKQAAIMMKGTKPSEVALLAEAFQSKLVSKIYGELV